MDRTEINNWFKDPHYDLTLLAKDKQERAYLRKIEDITERTGATNLVMAEYFLALEQRLEILEADYEDRNDLV
jgi:uncharacterized protein (DUF1330 family)